MASLGLGESCARCSAPTPLGMFCQSCGLYLADSAKQVERVTHNRRFFGDNLLEFVLFVVTLGIGWYIWLIFTAQTAQTPAKRLLSVYILDANTRTPVSTGRVWVREVLVKQLLVGFLSALIGVAGLINSSWVLFDRNRQALHDKVAGTIVVYAPLGLPDAFQTPTIPAASQPRQSSSDTTEQLRELSRLHEEGILTDEEYEKKRSELVKTL